MLFFVNVNMFTISIKYDITSNFHPNLKLFTLNPSPDSKNAIKVVNIEKSQNNYILNKN
jgi:hypothetical protein